MNTKRLMIPALAVLVLLLVPLAGLACGGGDEGDGSGEAAADEPTDLSTASGFIAEMTIAAEAGDLEAAEAAFESAHDPLHEVIEALEGTDADLAAELDEAIEHAEEGFEDGDEAEHIAEEAEEIAHILDEAAEVLEG